MAELEKLRRQTRKFDPISRFLDTDEEIINRAQKTP